MDLAADRRLKIGDLARITGLSIKTIRYYKSQREYDPLQEVLRDTVYQRHPDVGRGHRADDHSYCMKPLVELMGELRKRRQERGEPRSGPPGGSRRLGSWG